MNRPDLVAGMTERNWNRLGPNGDPEDSEGGGRRCSECDRLIPMGEDALTLERVVMGPRGPVPLDDVRFFHLDHCFAEYVCSTETEELPKRIP